MKRVTNTQAFAQYRQLLPTLLNGRDHGFFAQILDDDMRILMTVGVWAARYSARGSAIAGPLADTTAAAALIARNRARDVTEPMAQGWPPSLLQQIAQTMGVTRTGGEAMDVSAATDAHGFGPSLRALWAAEGTAAETKRRAELRQSFAATPKNAREQSKMEARASR